MGLYNGDNRKENGSYNLCMQSDHTPGDMSAEETTKRGNKNAGEFRDILFSICFSIIPI